MKRRMEIWLVMMVGMSILCHAVVPHHHYHKISVAIVHLHVHDHKLLVHSHHDDSHSHDGDGDGEECLINEVCAGAVLKVSVPEVETAILPVTGSWIAPLLHVRSLRCWMLDHLLLSFDDPQPEERHVIPYIIHAYMARIARAVVLRAPTC